MTTDDPAAGSRSPATFVGFDSAWTGNARAPGAVTFIGFDGEGFDRFQAPRLAGFDAAAALVRSALSSERATILALDQPTIVPNTTGMRPVEKVAASLVSWLGGGVQPANRGKAGMFGDDAPVWRFISGLGAVEDPEGARSATHGLHFIEVFPALALPALGEDFFGRKKGPRYNPGRRNTYLREHWGLVVDAVLREAERMGCGPLAARLLALEEVARPAKADQDRLDAAICLLVAIRWRMDGRRSSMMLGDLRNGYIVTPVSDATRARLEAKAAETGLPFR